MTASSDYTPPKVWSWNKASGGMFANINRPIAGPTHDKDLPVGRHPLQLYSLGTPNGQKVTMLLEELLALGHAGAIRALTRSRTSFAPSLSRLACDLGLPLMTSKWASSGRSRTTPITSSL